MKKVNEEGKIGRKLSDHKLNRRSDAEWLHLKPLSEGKNSKSGPYVFTLFLCTTLTLSVLLQTQRPAPPPATIATTTHSSRKFRPPSLLQTNCLWMFPPRKKSRRRSITDTPTATDTHTEETATQTRR